MFNPLDMFQAQNGAGTQTVAQQFGLTPEQTRRAMEALMPAFALGMQRSPAGDPTGLSQMFGMAGGRPASSPAETMLGQMFGSPALTQAILQQAASSSGVGSQVLRQMLPMIAGAVVASIVHMLLNPPAPEPAKAAPPSVPFPVNPVWAEMMKAFLPADAPAPKPPEQPPTVDPRAEAALGSTVGGMFQQMLKTGSEAQERNAKAMQGLFETFWNETGPDRAERQSEEPDEQREKGPADASAATSAPETTTEPVPHPETVLPEGTQKPKKGRPPIR